MHKPLAFTVLKFVWQQISYCFCYMHTLPKNIIFVILEINLKFSAAGIHPPFIPRTEKKFPKATTKTRNKKPTVSFPSSLS